MPSNFQKFIFLGILVVLALFSRVAYPTEITASQSLPSTGSSRIPFFVFPSLMGQATSILAASSVKSIAAAVTDGGQPADIRQNSSSAVPAGQVAAPPQLAMVGQVPATPSDNLQSKGAVQSPASVSTSHFSATGSLPPPQIADRATLIADLETGGVLYGSNADNRWPLASLSKLMTATIVLDKMDLNQKVTVTPAAVDADPGQTTLQAGDIYTVSDLLYVMLLPSSNVAAEALANAYGRDQFLAEMNARAAAWGMADTHYDDPSGLSVGNQSTADDLLRLAQKIYADYPQILAITRTPQVTIKELGSGRQAAVKSINAFAGRADFIGGKTGYTDEAAGNLLSIFKYENRPVLFVVLGTADDTRFANTLQLYQWFAQSFK